MCCITWLRICLHRMSSQAFTMAFWKNSIPALSGIKSSFKIHSDISFKTKYHWHQLIGRKIIQLCCHIYTNYLHSIEFVFEVTQMSHNFKYLLRYRCFITVVFFFADLIVTLVLCTWMVAWERGCMNSVYRFTIRSTTETWSPLWPSLSLK